MKEKSKKGREIDYRADSEAGSKLVQEVGKAVVASSGIARMEELGKGMGVIVEAPDFVNAGSCSQVSNCANG